ncbi:rab11 family-interacting protein 3 isoform X2 [Amia ocellicauda]|uniref:rab11 family-interacting protein 3 isoform X2 n=1 Tax=Amia ocellicauda TaxID=2972642 RepID=UPI00346463FB
MEQVLLSSPGGHSDWELEQKQSLGFLLLEPDKGAGLPKGGKESPESGLDFRAAEKELVSLSLDEILQENALNLDDLFRNSRYPSVDQILSWDKGPDCPVLQWEKHSIQGSDFNHNSPVELISFHSDSSPSVESEMDSAPLPDRDSLQACEVNLLDVGEGPPLLSQDEGLVSSSQEEALSSETQDKGSFLQPAMDLLTLSNAILEAVPEGSVSTTPHTCPAECDQLPAAQQEDGLQEPEEAVHLSVRTCSENEASSCPADPELPSSREECLSHPVVPSEQDASVETVTSSPEHTVEEVSPHLPLPCLSAQPHDLLSFEGDVLPRDEPHENPVTEPHSSRDSVHGELDLDLDISILDRVHEELGLAQCLPADVTHDQEISHSAVPEEMLHETPVLDEELDVDQDVSEDVTDREQNCAIDAVEGSLIFSPSTLRTSSDPAGGPSLADVEVSPSLPVGGSASHREDSQRPEDLSPLRAVFDALDQDRDGFVRIEEFVQFATDYGAEQVKDLTRFLDPSGLGVISFEDFVRGITTISNGGSELQPYDLGFPPGEEAGGCEEEYDDYTAFEQNEVTDSAYLGSESTYSECETFTDEDTGTLVHQELHEEVETDSAIDATLHDSEEAGSRLSLGSELNNHSLVTVISGQEEHFEDFGEGHDSERLPDDSDATEGDASPPSQVHSSTLLLSPSTSKRLSSKKVARHLHQSSALALDHMEELSRDILELAETDITDKVMFLEKRVSELEKDSTANGEQHARLRQENLQLVHRANALEEQLKEQESRSEEALVLELRRQKEALSRLERERGMELENLQSRLQTLDEENSELRSCVPCLRANIERLEEEKRKLQDEVEDVTDRLSEELEMRRKLSDKLSHERHLNQKEKESTQELIEDLRKQLEHLQLYKLEAEARRGRSSSAGLQEYNSRTREAELEQEIRRLKQDNRNLKEQNDELNGQIINLSIQGAKNLFSASFSESLAAEINSVSRDELMEAIHKQEEINYRLQDYIDRIIVAIMESNPSILEVK